MFFQQCNQQNCLGGRQETGWPARCLPLPPTRQPQKRLMEHSLKAPGAQSHHDSWALKQTQPVILLMNTSDQPTTIISH